MDITYVKYKIPQNGCMKSFCKELQRKEWNPPISHPRISIYIPEGEKLPPKSIINSPELQEYIVGFGNSKHDRAFVAEVNGKIVGAV